MRRRFDELDIFRKIYASSEMKLCTAGIVRIDLDESRILGMDETPSQKTGGSVNQRSVLIMMKTLGKALASCSSVMKIVKAMYDLVEIDRMLVEEYHILHVISAGRTYWSTPPMQTKTRTMTMAFVIALLSM
ncbi:hypothetical protein F5887DRAFT_351732 [Amanita rubescens]|nr:hypothetical protein F5887DRAFT_351732 [Amanita rubescens]